MFRLENLVPLGKKRKRIGRGGSRGGTSGKGHKGQKARSGGGIAIAFEGGQMPLYRRLPKRGFSNARFKNLIEIVNLSHLDKVFNDGETVSKETLMAKGIIKGKSSKGKFILKILGNGPLTKKLIISADRFSKTAIKIIKENGGQVIQESSS